MFASSSYSSAGGEPDSGPHRERILALSQRLETLQANLELESTRRTEALESKLSQAEQRVEEAGEAESAVARDVQAEVYGIERLLEEEKEERDRLLSQYVERIKATQENLIRNLREVTSSRKEGEGYVSKVLDEATSSLRADFVREMEILDETSRDMSALVEKDLPQLQEKLARLKVRILGIDRRWVE